MTATRVTPRRARTARRVASCCRSLLGLAVAVIALFVARRADAYAWMIRHDYTACAPCHYDPSGAQVMTPYGRAQSEILLRTKWRESGDDEDPAKLGGFFFGAIPLPEPLMLQADARTMFVRVMPPSPATAVNRVILMQADAAAAVSAGAFRASGSLGYLHEGGLGASVTRGTEDRLVSRQHWAGAVFGKDEAFLLRAGRMNVPYGLRVIEHTLLTRAATRTDINASQRHGVALAWNIEGWRAEVMGIAGNFQTRPDALRDRGGAGYIEHAFTSQLAAGVTSLVTHADHDLEAGRAAFRHAHGVFGRWAVAKPVVLMLETDLLVRSPKRQPTDIGGTGFLQVDVEPIQGVHVAGTGEILASDLGQPSTFGGWLSAFWFFAPHVDVRTDLVLRSVPGGDSRTTIPTLTAQIHGWL